MRLPTLRRFFADPDVAIDLGTANTRVFVVERGLVADEPTRVPAKTGSTKSASPKAEISGASDGFIAPMKRGLVRDIDATACLLRGMLRHARRFGLIKPRALVCAPLAVTVRQRSNLLEAVRRSGVTGITLVPEPLACAIGAGLDISLPYAQVIVDIGDGVTDVAVIRARRLIRARAMRKACGDLRSAVQRTVARRGKLVLYRREAERLLQESGAAAVVEADRRLPALGIDRHGCEAKIEISGREISNAVSPVIRDIVGAVRDTVLGLSPEIAVEVMESGICLTGGGACLPGIDRLIAAETSIDVKIASDPLHATINGAGQMLANSATAGLWESGSL